MSHVLSHTADAASFFLRCFRIFDVSPMMQTNPMRIFQRVCFFDFSMFSGLELFHDISHDRDFFAALNGKLSYVDR